MNRTDSSSTNKLIWMFPTWYRGDPLPLMNLMKINRVQFCLVKKYNTKSALGLMEAQL